MEEEAEEAEAGEEEEEAEISGMETTGHHVKGSIMKKRQVSLIPSTRNSSEETRSSTSTP